MPSPRRIDVHFHLIPQFYKDAVYEAGTGPAIGRYPEWSPERALELMDANGVEVALTSLAQPGVQFGDPKASGALARRCNDYAAELNALWPRRFGGFGTIPMGDMREAVSEIEHCLDRLKLQGVCLFASYGEKFLGDPLFDPVLAALNERDAVVFVHPALHPSSRNLELPWPGFMMEYLFDTTRAVVNLVFGGAIERFPRIRFVLPHAGGVIPYFAWRLSVSPMIDPRLPQISARGRLRAAQAFLVRQCARAHRRDHGVSQGGRVAGADRLRQRLAVRQRQGDRRGGEDLRSGDVHLPGTARRHRPRERLGAFPAIRLRL